MFGIILYNHDDIVFFNNTHNTLINCVCNYYIHSPMSNFQCAYPIMVNHRPQENIRVLCVIVMTYDTGTWAQFQGVPLHLWSITPVVDVAVVCMD